MRYFLIIFLLVLYVAPSRADVAVPFSTTFDCAEWITTDGEPTCDGLLKWGDWSCSNGDETYEYARITDPANYSGGGGGKGFRSWDGDGANNGSGSVSITFMTPQPEVWVRWYMRYPLGFTWSTLAYEKLLYFDAAGGNTAIPEFYYGGFDIYSPAGGRYSQAGWGWTEIMGGATGDGLWHYYEVHLKMDTDGTDGIGQIYVDGVLRLDRSTIDFGTQAAGWTRFQLTSNQDSPDNGQCEPVDVDDVAISNTAYIGPLVEASNRLIGQGDIDELGW